jgi:hypothetical protein
MKEVPKARLFHWKRTKLNPTCKVVIQNVALAGPIDFFLILFVGTPRVTQGANAKRSVHLRDKRAPLHLESRRTWSTLTYKRHGVDFRPKVVVGRRGATQQCYTTTSSVQKYKMF